MYTLVYDGSFNGLLTTIFDVYEYRYTDVALAGKGHVQHNIFNNTQVVYTDEQKSKRIWKGLQQRISNGALMQLYKTYLSEQPDAACNILRYAQYAFANKESVEKDYAHEAVRYVMETAQKVHREKHRMEAFVRFQRAGDDLYHAIMEPDFNVLPLIIPHFQKRYADQRWLIYDVKRKYGIYYDLYQAQYVNIDFNTSGSSEGTIATILDTEEMKYQDLWQKYFRSTNISARKNMKLHIRHMPRRYWKYLTEKQLLAK